MIFVRRGEVLLAVYCKYCTPSIYIYSPKNPWVTEIDNYVRTHLRTYSGYGLEVVSTPKSSRAILYRLVKGTVLTVKIMQYSHFFEGLFSLVVVAII